MAVMTGQVTGADQASMAGLSPRMVWVPSRTMLHDGTLVVATEVEAKITGTRFSVNVEPTHSGEWYTIRVDYLDAVTGKLVRWEELDRKIEVPAEGGDLSGSLAVSISPDRVYIGLEPPEQDWPFYLNAKIENGVDTGSGDLFRIVG